VDKENCKNCRFSLENSENSRWCRKNPPIPSDDVDGWARYPSVHNEWWCGSYEANPPMRMVKDE
jgi:hypothetical protein